MGVVDTSLGAVKLEVEALKLVRLAASFDRLSLVHLLQTGELSPHLSTLHFDSLDLSFEILELGASIVVLVSLGNSIFSQSAGLEVFLVQKTLGTGKFVVQVEVLLGPTGQKAQKFA